MINKYNLLTISVSYDALDANFNGTFSKDGIISRVAGAQTLARTSRSMCLMTWLELA